MEKDLVEASSSVLTNPGSSCDPGKAEGDLYTSEQSRNVSDMSQKDELLSDWQNETEPDHDDQSDLVEASSSVLTNPGSSCDPGKAEGDLYTSEQSRNVSDMSRKDELLSDWQNETEPDHDDQSVASGAVLTSLVKSEAKHPGAIPKKRPIQQAQSSDSEESINVQQAPMVTVETFSSMVAVSALEENISSPEELKSKPIHMESTEPPYVPLNSDWPPWSLPPPERDKRHPAMSANSDQGINNESCTLVEEKFAQSRMLTKKLASHSHSPPPESSILEVNETFSKQNETSDVEIINQICLTGQNTTVQSSIPLYPPTCTPKEGGNSSHNASSLVTGPQLLGTSESATVVACGSTCRSRENMNSQQSRNPAEHDDVVKNDGLFQELKKENDRLLLDNSYLVQELRIQSEEKRTTSLENVELKHQLEASRAENAELLAQCGELTDLLNERETLIAENLETIQMVYQLFLQKTEECDRLKERVRLPVLEDDD